MEWKEGLAKLFISHVHSQGDIVRSVRRELAERGVGAFVAPVSIAPGRDWEEDIKEALQTCEAIAAFLCDGFRESDWTDQEIGYGVGRKIPIIPLSFGLEPYGFMRRWQAAPCGGKTPDQISDIIHRAMLDDDRTEDSTVGGLLHVLGRSGSFAEANRRAGYLLRIEDWSSIDRRRALERCLNNVQVHDAGRAKKIIEEILA